MNKNHQLTLSNFEEIVNKDKILKDNINFMKELVEVEF